MGQSMYIKESSRIYVFYVARNVEVTFGTYNVLILLASRTTMPDRVTSLEAFTLPIRVSVIRPS